MKKPIIALAAALVAALAIAAADAVKIEWKPKAGETYKSKVKAKANMEGPTGPMEVEFSATTTSKVLEIQADGNVVVEEVQSDVVIKVGGNEMGEQPSGKSTSVLKPSGAIVSTKSEPEGGSPRFNASFEFEYPGKELEVGKSWTIKRDADSGKGLFAREWTYTYDGKETVGKWECYRIKVAFKEIDANPNMTYDGTLWLSTADGSPVKGIFRFKNAVFGEGMPPADATIESMRVE